MRYDVVIVGAGIAGCGLAYNLKRLGYKGSVLVIDKEKLNVKNKSYRITFKDTVEKYKLPYEKDYSYLKFHLPGGEIIDIKVKSFLLEYGKTCKFLLQNSDCEFRNEQAINVKESNLVSDKSSYDFKYLIDCSGNNFFVKRLLGETLPMKYWVGFSKILESQNNRVRSFHYFFHEDGCFEDIYQVKDELMYGYWKYTNDADLKLEGESRYDFVENLIEGKKVIKKFVNVVPCAPMFPLIKEKIAFLGDSFGNATTSSAEGIKPILDSSEILAEAIMQSDLKFYERVWKDRYLNSYIRFLALKMARYPDSPFWKSLKERFLPKNLAIYDYLKKDPYTLFKILRNDGSFEMPAEFKKCFSKLNYVILASIYLNLKLKYAMM